MKRKNKLNPAAVSMWIILLSGMYSQSIFDTGIGIQTALADPRYGILGQKAPELNLDNWIDKDGEKMDPVRLSDYRGKIVYLYFFQNW